MNTKPMVPPQKDSLELFDLWNDPHELHNIIDNHSMPIKVAELRTARPVDRRDGR